MEKKKDIREKNKLSDLFKKNETGLKDGVFTFSKPMKIEEIAPLIKKQVSEIVKYFFMKGKMYNPSKFLTMEEIAEYCLENDIYFNNVESIDETNIFDKIITNDEKNTEKRPPIVTIMGHVDHGKTTLLDYIRNANVVKSEVGGITQHIGAYQITYNKNLITFIDTPGHEAFSAMRERGANVTDIVVLVVAGDDGIKPQTKEAIKHAKKANVPIIIFINKMDKPNVNPESVMSQLSNEGLTPEEWGGEYLTIKGSALTGMNVDKLLESILLIAELNEYKTNKNKLAIGTVIESLVEKGLGNSISVIVQTGTLKKGDFVIAGSSYGKIKIMFDENGKEVKEAEPSKPVKIIGLNNLVNAGIKFYVSDDENEIKEIANKIKIKENEERLSNNNEKLLTDSEKTMNIILRTDVFGTLEAIKKQLSKINVEGMKLNIIKSDVGGINENDVTMAAATKSIIIGFNIKPSTFIRELADKQKIKILFYNIIYKLEEDIEQFLIGKLEPINVEKETGEAKIQQLWLRGKGETIAGCICMNGEINRNDNARLLRDGKVLFEKKIASMKHLKDNVNKVSAGMEFGITLENVYDLKPGDIIQTYKIVQEKRT